MKIAIYTRKSKLTDQGDSIANQITMCKDYANAYFKECEFFIYEDEGFTGGNTDRPMFKQLTKDIAKNKFDVLICYRLDRISRNVANFAETLNLLDSHNVGFVSIKEQFDTTTPMGKAMMYISSVFAQLERDTIAERITDNLAALVKKGNYVGSLTPQGYKKKQLTSSNGKHYNVLEIDNEEVERVKFFFDKYLEWQSINKLEVYCLQNGFKTRGGYNYKGVSIRRILTHPIYAAADKYTHEYFKNLGCQIYDPLEKWNGTKGIAVFRRAAKNENNPAQWLVGVGEHEPIISSAKWIQIQDIIEKRRGLTIRRPIGKWGVLSGVLRCSSCGDYMRPFSRSSKTKHFYYVCSTKEKSRKEICSMKNIRGDILDDEIINKLQGLLKDSGFVSKELKTKQNNADEKIKQNAEQYSKYKAEIAKNENSIKNLVMRLAESENSTITKYISEQITELDERNSFLRQALVSLDISKDSLEVENINAELVGEAIEKIHAPNFKELEFNAKRNIIKTIVEKIVWDGDNVDISFH